MKKILQLGAFLFAVLIAQYSYAQSYDSGCGNGRCGQEAQQCCDQPCGECWCKFVRYDPCYYNCWRCEDCPRTCKQRCCRYVPQYYQVQRCRWVPQYYCQTVCCSQPQYYYVDRCINCKKWVCDRKCQYIPRYYYKQCCQPVCGNNGCNSTCNSGCNTGCCDNGSAYGGAGYGRR